MAIMFTGIGVLGVLAGSLAELFHLDEPSAGPAPAPPPMHAELTALRGELQAVELRLGELVERTRASATRPLRARPRALAADLEARFRPPPRPADHPIRAMRPPERGISVAPWPPPERPGHPDRSAALPAGRMSPRSWRDYRREHLPGVERLRQNGVSFRHHYPMAAACAPSRASLLTGQYPSLHGVTQTDGIAKSADGDDMFWLAPDAVPTLGDWFRAGGYRTYYKGKWHASHAHLDAEDGEGFLLSIDDDGTPIEENIEQYLEADLLDDYGFSEWVGPEPHGLGKHNTGTVKDPFTADETIALLKRLDADEDDEPWLTVCSFLNPHDDSLFGVIALAQGLRYHPSTGAARRPGTDPRGGSLDQALLPAELVDTGARCSRRSRGSRRT